MPTVAAGLPISAVSARTGVGIPALRAWEQRFGFPTPERLAGGHRRYAEGDVGRILRVVAERDAGRSLEAAIALVVRESPAGGEDETDRSIFSGLRRAHPSLPLQVLHRRTMLAMSHAIEDECFARADRPHLVAAFQTRSAYAMARPRWDGLTASASQTIVFADFARNRQRGSRLEIAVPAGDPLRREWSVVCDAPGSAAALAGWERPDGRFEAVWTVEPDAVRLATDIGRRLAARHAPRLPPCGPIPLDAPAQDPVATLRRCTALTNRLIVYLDR